MLFFLSTDEDETNIKLIIEYYEPFKLDFRTFIKDKDKFHKIAPEFHFESSMNC